MIKHLISTTEFVAVLQNRTSELEQLYRNKTCVYIEWNSWLWRLVVNYTNFISQKPTLSMFILCDEVGNILEEPKLEDWEMDNGDINYYALEIAKQEYQHAQSKILFKGWNKR